MCFGFENCENNEDKYFKEAMNILSKLIESIRKENLFSENESMTEIDP